MDRKQFLTVGAAAASGLLLADTIAAAPAWAWPKGCIEHLPKSSSKRMAWTLDDGSSKQSLRAYLDLLEDHENLRMTMFVLPRSSAWKALAKPITALAETGRLQLANHTYSHIDLTRISDAKLKRELVSTTHFIQDNFGVDPGTYYRPPYGYINAHVIKVARDLGYTTPVLWLGSTGSDARVAPSSVWKMCQKWMTDGRIVIDHANSMATPRNFDRIRALLATRHLNTVTLKDAFGHN